MVNAPDVARVARDNRRWVRRVVRWLTAEAGVGQFLDVGSGLPTVENTHDVVHRIQPASPEFTPRLRADIGPMLGEQHESADYMVGGVARKP